MATSPPDFLEIVLARHCTELSRHSDLLEKVLAQGIRLPMLSDHAPVLSVDDPMGVNDAPAAVAPEPPKRGPGRPPRAASAAPPPVVLPHKDEVRAAVFAVRNAKGEAVAKSLIETVGGVTKLGDVPAERGPALIAACQVAMDEGEDDGL